MIIKLTRSTYGHLRGLAPNYDYIDICMKKETQDNLGLKNTTGLVAYAIIKEEEILIAKGRDNKEYRKYYGYVEMLPYEEGKKEYERQRL